MKRKLRTESESPLEKLRLDYTNLNQDEFVVKCGLSRATYRRWITGETTPKFTAEQIINICRICQISFALFFTKLGVDISGIPEKELAYK
jgi:transcriptional regulator with XRE-family HTH domain